MTGTHIYHMRRQRIFECLPPSNCLTRVTILRDFYPNKNQKIGGGNQTLPKLKRNTSAPQTLRVKGANEMGLKKNAKEQLTQHQTDGNSWVYTTLLIDQRMLTRIILRIGLIEILHSLLPRPSGQCHMIGRYHKTSVCQTDAHHSRIETPHKI